MLLNLLSNKVAVSTSRFYQYQDKYQDRKKAYMMMRSDVYIQYQELVLIIISMDFTTLSKLKSESKRSKDRISNIIEIWML